MLPCHNLCLPQVERYQGLNDRLVQMQEENRQLYNTVQVRLLQAGSWSRMPGLADIRPSCSSVLHRAASSQS